MMQDCKMSRIFRILFICGCFTGLLSDPSINIKSHRTGTARKSASTGDVTSDFYNWYFAQLYTWYVASTGTAARGTKTTQRKLETVRTTKTTTATTTAITEEASSSTMVHIEIDSITTESIVEESSINTSLDITQDASTISTEYTDNLTSETPPDTLTESISKVTKSTRELTSAKPNITQASSIADVNSLTIGLVALAGVLGLLLICVLTVVAVMCCTGKLHVNMSESRVGVKPRPLSRRGFEAHCKMTLDTPAPLAGEYELLQALSGDVHDSNTFTAADWPENAAKNRFINVLPYDLTRVKLDLTDDVSSSDYINASFIKGFSNSIEYIATQHPLQETVADFWRMVLQHRVQLIVMMTSEERGGRRRVDYLPNNREQTSSGDIVVRCGTEINFQTYTQRSIILHKDNSKWSLTHLQFTDWPAVGCPEETSSILEFCITMRTHMTRTPHGLMLVHCNSESGVTGTLIAIDILLQRIQGNTHIDVFDTVFNLRKQRTNLVQSISQYAFIYKSIRGAIHDPLFIKSINTNNSKEHTYENVDTKITFIYERLPQLDLQAEVSESASENI